MHPEYGLRSLIVFPPIIGGGLFLIGLTRPGRIAAYEVPRLQAALAAAGPFVALTMAGIGLLTLSRRRVIPLYAAHLAMIAVLPFFYLTVGVAPCNRTIEIFVILMAAGVCMAQVLHAYNTFRYNSHQSA